MYSKIWSHLSDPKVFVNLSFSPPILFFQQHILINSRCGNCSTWHVLAADTWGVTYQNITEANIFEPAHNNTKNSTGIIEKIELLRVRIYELLVSF